METLLEGVCVCVCPIQGLLEMDAVISVSIEAEAAHVDRFPFATQEGIPRAMKLLYFDP